MKYLFILGRNPELSRQEVLCFFETKGVEIISEALIDNALLLEFRMFGGGDEIDMETIDKLGGVISIGRVLSEFKEFEGLDKIDIYKGTKNNFSYVVWNFSKHKDYVSDYLKKRFRGEKLKASEKRMREEMILQNGDKAAVVNSNVDQEYFVFNDYFGNIIRHCDYSQIEKRDMEKPVRRESLSISPRLAKIMINLSKVKEDENLVDGFCGIGVILQEALLQNIKVVGIDTDKKAIEGARENMKYFNFPRGEYMLLKGDSGRIEIERVRAMVSEPDFGDTLKKIPTKNKAEEMIERYEKIMISVLNNMKKYVSGRFVFTSPYIRIGKKRLSANFENLSSKTGLKIVEGFPIPEFRENQIVGREIVVFEK
jgi:tRNA G10  N-methylase Trm11